MTTFFLPLKSFRLMVRASLLAGNALRMLVAGRSMGGAGFPTSTLPCPSSAEAGKAGAARARRARNAAARSQRMSASPCARGSGETVAIVGTTWTGGKVSAWEGPDRTPGGQAWGERARVVRGPDDG